MNSMNPEPSRVDLAKVPAQFYSMACRVALRLDINLFLNFQMQALQQKRTLAFVNHCVMTNVQCLNNFMQVCEEKLMLFERKIDQVEAAMVLLESKVSLC